MVVCNFNSVMKIIFEHISEGKHINAVKKTMKVNGSNVKVNQANILSAMFSAFTDETGFEFDEGNSSKWIHGDEELTSTVTSFYLADEAANRENLCESIENILFPLMYNVESAADKIYKLVIYDKGIYKTEKQYICELYPCRCTSDIANFFANVIMFTMERIYKKGRKRLSFNSSFLSPALDDYLYVKKVPKPCKHFCGRENEIENLHELLVNNGKVFVYGTHGIGKSEFVKDYADKHKNDYNQILYLTYIGSLENTIAEIRFADDGAYPRETPGERFYRHNDFLRCLGEDTLIIIDNFNTTASEEKLLDEIINYNCRIIFTTRSRFDEYISCEHIEIQDFDALFSLVKYFYSNAEAEKEIVDEIIGTVHRHTMSVVMAAQVLENGIHDPAVVLDKLIEGYGILDSSDVFSVPKDGKNPKATHERHIQTLFMLHDLTEREQNIMRNMVFIPLDGISPRLFAKWLELSDMNDISRLIELGYIQKSDGKIKLHSLIKDITISLLRPAMSNCETLLNSLCAYCKRDDVQDYELLFQIADNIIAVITNDNVDRHFSFICAVFPLMHKQMYGHGMKLIIDRFDENYDPAALYHFRAMYEEAINANPDKAFELEKQAFEHCDDNNAFAFKINSNLGYYYHHFGNRELAELHYRNAFSLCHRRIEALEDLNDVILATRQYINLILDADRIIEAIDILEKWIIQIRERFGEINSPYADMLFFKGVVAFKSENEKSGWHCFREAVRVYSVIYENNADEQREKIEMIINVIKSFNLTPSPDYDDFTEQITGKTAVLL